MGIFDFLKKSAEEQNTKAESENLTGNFVMKIDDVFNIPGRGTVVSGKIATGNIKLGEEIIIKANQTITAMVTGIEAFSTVLDAAKAGDTVGLLLDNVNHSEVKKGSIATKAVNAQSEDEERGYTDDWDDEQFNQWLKLREAFRVAQKNKDYEQVIEIGNQILELDTHAKFIKIYTEQFRKSIETATKKLNINLLTSNTKCNTF